MPFRVGVEGTVFEWPSHGGIARTYAEILPRISVLDDAIDVLVFTDAGGGPTGFTTAGRIGMRRSPDLRRYLRPHRVLGRLREPARALSYGWALRGSSCDLWHATYFTVPVATNVPVVVSNYDMVHRLFPRLYSRRPADDAFRRRQERALLRADHIIANSETTKADTARLVGIDPDRITAIPLACSPQFRRLPPEHGLAASPALEALAGEGRPYLLYVGGRYPHKNFWGLVEGFAAWKREDFLLVVAGPPLDGQERCLLARSGVLDRVRMVVRPSDEELVGLYNAAAAFVYPSLYEGFGVPLLEALSCGCPVVASRIPSSREVAGDLAVYFDLEDAGTLLQALESAVQRGREPGWLEAARVRAAEYSWEACARSTLDVYRMVCA